MEATKSKSVTYQLMTNIAAEVPHSRAATGISILYWIKINSWNLLSIQLRKNVLWKEKATKSLKAKTDEFIWAIPGHVY